MLELAIHPTPVQVEGYRELLRSEWTKNTLIEALALARSVFETTGASVVFPWEQTVASRPHTEPRHVLPAVAEDYLLEYIERRDQDLAKGKKRSKRNRTEGFPADSKFAFQIHFHLTLLSGWESGINRSVHVIDSAGFYRDICSLLVMLVCDVGWTVSPLTDSIFNLYDVIRLFAYYLWNDQPTHRNALLAAAARLIGDDMDEISYLTAAHECTSPDAHEYLTSAQILIFALLDRREFDKAELIVLRLARNCRETDLPEVLDISRQVFQSRTLSAEVS